MFALAASAQHYPILPVAGSPRNITALLEDSRSAIWIGTKDDVVCFDGSRFYSLRPYGFPKEPVSALAEDSDGGIWIGTTGPDLNGGTGAGGIYRYKQGHVQRVMTGDVLSFAFAAPGKMLASFQNVSTSVTGDLYLIQNQNHDQGVWLPEKISGIYAAYITIDHRGNALFPCSLDMCEFSQSQLQHWPTEGTQPKVTNILGTSGPSRILRDRFDCLWFRSSVGVTYRCPGDPEILLLPGYTAGAATSTEIEEAPDGSILLDSGLVRGRPGAFQQVSFETAPDSIRGGQAGLLTRDGTILLGGGDGLSRFMYPYRMEYWKKGDGSVGGFSFLRLGKSVYSAAAGVPRLSTDRARWTPVTKADEFANTVHIYPGPAGTIYAATISGGIIQMSPEGKEIAKSDGLLGGARIAGDADGHLWLAGIGISSVTRNGNRLKLTPEGNLKGSSLDLKYDEARKTLWGCFNNEVVALRDGTWLHLSAKDGLRDNLCRSVTVAPNGDVWVAYASFDAFSRIRGAFSGRPEIRNFESGGEVGNASSTFLDTDSRGWLWRASDGVDYIAASDYAERGQWLRLDEEAGLPEGGGNQNSFYSDPDGSVWFGTIQTTVHFNPPEGFATSFPAPPVFIAGIAADGAEPVFADLISSIPHGKAITAEIGSGQYDRRSAIRLRYRLLPGDGTWSEANGFEVPLGKLSIGKHTLEVQSRLFTGDWSDTARTAFTVLWPVWLGWPALLLYGAGGTSLGLGIRSGASAWRRRQQFRRDIVLPDISAWRMGALSPETERLVGTTIDGRYEIGHILSIGGFATVARARDLRRGGELCAIKIFRYGLADADWIRHRFKQEVAALEQLSHSNIVRITDHGNLEGGAPYLVMEFIHGVSLRDLLLEQGKLTRHEAGSFLSQIADALRLLHEHSIYHRDLKPENLMVRSSPDRTTATIGRQIVLIDFSIALVKAPEQTFHGISRVAGSLDYMAPEQLTGYADSSTDIHSLAKVVIEMLHGSRWSELLEWATLDMPGQARAYLSREPHGLSRGSIEMLAQALAFDPTQRPQDVSVFAAGIVRDLEAAP